MKKLVSYISIAAMILVAGACNKQGQPDEASGKMSDLQYLIDGLVRTDEAGNITGYNIGDCLNEADPLDISVPVDDFEEALRSFKSIIPADAVLVQDATSVTWNMTDPDGKAEGKAVLKKNEELGAVATLTITPLLQANGSKTIPSVTFLPPILWPHNSGAAEGILNRDYYVGAAVWKEKDEGFGSGEFLVIRKWTPQDSGIMIQMSNHAFNGVPSQSVSSMNTLHQVHKALMANYQLLVEVYGRAHDWPSLDNWYPSKSQRWWGDRGFLNLMTDKEDWSWLSLSQSGFYLVSVYYFRPDGDKIKFW